MPQKPDPTYDYICFSELAYEPLDSNPENIEGKIKRRLTYYKLPAYDHERLAYIRSLKNKVYDEISRLSDSSYYQRGASIYAELSDFDVERMASDLLKIYTTIDREEMIRMLNFALYLYYLR